MKALKRRTLTLLIGIVVAVAAVIIGSSFAQSHKVADLQVAKQMPSVNLIDFNKVFYVIFHK